MADSDMLEAAEAEVKRLEAELQATTAYKKLQLAKQVVALYRPAKDQELAIAGRIAEQRMVHELQERLQNRTTKTARIEAAAAKYLKAKGARAPANELLGPVEQEGIEVGGKEPVKALSSYLSSSKVFNNQRELGGYGLAEWGHRRGPDLLTKTGA
jgi:hypothetical protein